MPFSWKWVVAANKWIAIRRFGAIMLQFHAAARTRIHFIGIGRTPNMRYLLHCIKMQISNINITNAF